MKKHLLALSLSLILLAVLPWYAMANQWGISGELYTAVSDAGDTWDAYSVMGASLGHFGHYEIQVPPCAHVPDG